jgi:tetratricopeptide (TPR) repeat protein
MTTYLKRFYFDDRKLQQRALLELVRAFETGRMIAFIGSMATESLGYGGWKDLVTRYVEKAADESTKPGTVGDNLARQAAVNAIVRVRDFHGDESLLDKRVALSVVKEALGAIDEEDPLDEGSRVRRLEQAAAEIFGTRKPLDRAEVEAAPVHALRRHLGIRRFATLNYDVEIEAALMVEPDDRVSHLPPLEQLRTLMKDGRIRQDANAKYRLTRLMSNGLAIESDIRDRDRPDRMIEFAVGSADVDYRIMHLHGRASAPDTMIVGLRDYDRLYRKNDLAKLPFEHGQRILFGGNPVLFAGVGMSEPEVNATLQDFVSNNPYRRFAPAFLLWNTARFSAVPEVRANQIVLRRIDFLQRLGVFAIFDTDIDRDERLEPRLQALRERNKALASLPPGDPATDSERQNIRDEELSLFRDSILQISLAAETVDLELRSRGVEWRSVVQKMRKLGGKEALALWGTSCAPCTTVPKDLRPERLVRRHPSKDGNPGQVLLHTVIVSDNGAGKGSFAWWLSDRERLPQPFNVRRGNRLIINAGFSFDTDFLLLAISKFLLKLKGEKKLGQPAGLSREKQFEQPGAFKLTTPGLVIINGMERFFTVAGAPLSAELDHLLRQVVRMTAAESDVRWIFLGSERIQKYFATISPASIVPFEQLCPGGWLQGRPGRVSSVYLSGLFDRFRAFAISKTKNPEEVVDRSSRLILDASASADAHALRRAAFAALLTPETLERVGVERTGLALEIIRAMAFIGSPVDDVVLLHVPRIRKLLAAEASTTAAGQLVAMLKDLVSLGLVTAVSRFDDNPTERDGLWLRYGLHSAVSWELRHQFGVPLSESKLSTSFNMSLFVAQPVDGFVPEVATHKELAELVDRLVGAYKDDLRPAERARIPDSPQMEEALSAAAQAFVPDPVEADSVEKLHALCAPAATAALRAALAVVRGYYSTTSLLTLDRDDRRVNEDQDGVLLEHAERLERLVRSYRKLSRFRGAAAKKLQTAAARRSLGPEPFYPDDLVWIHNELGVVYLAQGDLYSARRAFRAALKVNQEAVEFACHSHNWRRIMINHVLLDIERANLTSGERKLQQIEDSIDQRPPVNEPTHQSRQSSRFAFIRSHFGDRAPAERCCFDREIMHEELLMTGLVLGHRGLCQHLRGHVRAAEPLYRDAIAILRRLGEHRAYAFFQRHFAQLLRLMETGRDHEAEMRLAVTAAESVRQMDMAYHARIVEAGAAWKKPGADARDRHRALRQLTEAASYGALMDLHRLRIEAGIALASLKFESGDYETALDHATEAMALAARYGHSLRKISLRLDMAQILMRRGDPKSGAALLAQAVEAADRFGYQRAVESAQRIRLAETASG